MLIKNTIGKSSQATIRYSLAKQKRELEPIGRQQASQ